MVLLMRKNETAVFLFLVIFLLSFASALRNEAVYQCKKDCNLGLREDIETCNLEFKDCKQECNSLECKIDCYKEKNDCRKMAKEENKMCKNFCSLGEFYVERDLCLNSGGSYQQLCNGNYFDLRCSKEYYCVCNGNLNYSCPLNHFCAGDFSVKNISTIETSWKNPVGIPMGDIGICMRN